MYDRINAYCVSPHKAYSDSITQFLCSISQTHVSDLV